MPPVCDFWEYIEDCMQDILWQRPELENHFHENEFGHEEDFQNWIALQNQLLENGRHV